MVSIIIPMHNSEKYIKSALDGIINQTYKDLEVLVVDDCSTDSSVQIVKEYMKNDNRIKLYKNSINCGAGISRNVALQNAKGRYIAYLDSDDIWRYNKLERQLNFMKKTGYAFTGTSYEVIGENGESKGKIVHMPKDMNYLEYLKNTIIQTVSVMVDTKLVDKAVLEMPCIRKRQDAATWCKILKSGFEFHGLDENLAMYRRRTGSVSSNKFSSAKGTWNLYRKIEKLGLFKSIYCFMGYAYNAVKKRVYYEKMISNVLNKKMK